MNKHFSLSILSLLLVLVFAASTFAQKPASKPSPSPSPTPLKLERESKFDGDVTFPEVDGWDLTARQQYPTPDMGYSHNYESSSGRVTIYVYNGGRTSIPNALTGVVAEEVKMTQAGILMFVERGSYESAKELKNETVALGGANGKVKSLHVLYALRAGGRDLDSHIYLFPYNNYFIKIRMTGPPAKEPSADTVALFEALDLLFSK